MSSETQYKGVGGWLLLFCLGLTVFGPALGVGGLVFSWQKLSPYFGRFPGLRIATMLQALLTLCLAGFCIYAGVRLWRIRPGAVRTAKNLLLSSLGYHVIYGVLPLMAGLPSTGRNHLIEAAVFSIAKGVVYVAIWYSYLCSSKRVKATYGS